MHLRGHLPSFLPFSNTLSAKESELESVRSRNDELESTFSSLTSRNEELARDIGFREEEIAALRKEIEELNSKIERDEENDVDQVHHFVTSLIQDELAHRVLFVDRSGSEGAVRPFDQERARDGDCGAAEQAAVLGAGVTGEAISQSVFSDTGMGSLDLVRNNQQSLQKPGRVYRPENSLFFHF